ncbi:MAG TPA: molybdopterin-dependent oxidoreductase [Sporichthyaceae bacterium]
MTATLPLTDNAAGQSVVRAACPHDCPDTCAMLVTVENGKALGVRGDPDHPFTDGGLCVKVNNFTDTVYSPDRILFPLRRTGPKGSGQFERISWDSAIEEIGSRFTSIVSEYGAEAILPISYLGTQGILNGLNAGDAFFNRLGATVSERTFCDSGCCTAYAMTVGATAGVDPESLVHSKFILIWACNMISTNLHLWKFVAEAQRRGAKVVVVDPVRTRTAKRADWHLPIRPGTDGALALAMIHVIINEGLIDEAYVRDHTAGFTDLAERVGQYTPEFAAAETGLDAEDIRTLAREYATTQPSMIRIGVAIERHAGGGQTVRALASLPALVGAWRKVGGGILQLPLWAFPVNWPAFLGAEMIKPGTRVLNQFLLGRHLNGDIPLDPPIKALMVYNSNPVIVCPEQDKMIEGLKREDLFTVVSEHFLTDTADWADIVLPATSQLEQHDIMFSWGHLYVTLNQPAIEPLGEAIPNTELFRRLGRRMGFTEGYFTRTDEDMLAAAFDWSAPAMQGITLESLRETGWARLNLPDPDHYAPHAEGNFPTPSGKTEFVASIAAGGNFVLPLFRQGSNDHQAGQPVDPLPHYIPPRESSWASGRGLNLISPKAHSYLNSSYGDQPAQRRVAGDPAILLHPTDAADRKITDGDEVRVFNDRGSFTVVARTSDEIAPGVACAYLGAWRKLSRALATVSAVNSFEFADLGNAPTFSDTLVEVERT